MWYAFSQGHLMQMTMMTPPSFNNELHYLNKEDRLLRWVLVKHRDVRHGEDFLGEDEARRELNKFRSNVYDDNDDIEDDDDDDEDEVDQVERRED